MQLSKHVNFYNCTTALYYILYIIYIINLLDHMPVICHIFQSIWIC